jgi:uncharacterized RDD family membrane protein YckC
MKCPKCGYLGFEDVERCRNCGYEFSLTTAPAIPDLTIRRDTRALTPLDDLSLVSASSGQPRMRDVAADVDRLFGAPDDDPRADLSASLAAAAPSSAPPAPVRPQPPAAAPLAAAAELPLFGSPAPDDEPLITRASPPRAPLAVRRSTPDVPRVRADAPRAAVFDLALDDAPADRGSFAGRSTTTQDDPRAPRDAAVAARFAAVVIDLVILATIDAVVIYFTMQICGISMADVDILPKGPLIAFLIVQNGGYLVTFTAGGQTLGKMAAGIRVVPAESEAQLDLGRAFLRTLMWVLLAVPAGLGFLTAVASRDHRGLHDRFAGTRVVRASA